MDLSVGLGIAFLIIIAGVIVLVKRRRQRRGIQTTDVERHVAELSSWSMAPFAPITKYCNRINTYEASSEAAMSEIEARSPVYEMHSPDAENNAYKSTGPKDRY